ncbi:hypothetical protein ABT173_01690 [Streptomyces sp. NPDC001795]|uniref:hypothetical protein n=1 Tax=Streptomyces sp. NPDC001795 TaxID=3154525 RepID=UPI00333338A3
MPDGVGRPALLCCGPHLSRGRPPERGELLNIDEISTTTQSGSTVHPPLSRQAVIDVLDDSDPMTIRDVIVMMYRNAGHEDDVWSYEDAQRLGEVDRYRKLILSMLRSGDLVRTEYGSHYVTTAAQMLRWKSQTPFTVVALRSDSCPDVWIIVACLRGVVFHDDQWTMLPTEEDWSRYCGTFRGVNGEAAVEAALSAWEKDEDSSEDLEVDIEADVSLDAEDSAAATRLLQLADSLQVDPANLDEAVHDAAARYASDACNASGAADDADAADEMYDEAGRQAADEVNNSGLHRQVPYLVAQYGAEKTEEIIRGAAAPDASSTAHTG